jgi:hypothetical protein
MKLSVINRLKTWQKLLLIPVAAFGAIFAVGLIMGVVQGIREIKNPPEKDASAAVPTNSPQSTPALPVPSDTPLPASTPQAKKPMEILLASIDKGSEASPEDTAVKRFRFLLSNIESKTKNTRDQIGDMTVNARDLLREKYGQEKTLLELLEDANRAIPEGTGQKFDYAEIVTAVVMIEGQQ